MSYRFVQSNVDLGPRRGPVLALVIHMAEGGGTVGYLSRPNPNGVSVHFVIEYDGEIVQMLQEDRMHTSIRTSAIRASDDSDGFFGRSAALDTLGAWADTRTTLGPNHATLAVEIEGFAATGPNARQRAALMALVDDLRARYPSLGLLGHRDFADYKACPGKLIPWNFIGGHGPIAEEEPMGLNFKITSPTPGRVRVKSDAPHYLIRLRDGQPILAPAGSEREVVAKVALLEPFDDAPGDRVNGFLIGRLLAPTVEAANVEAAFLLATDGEFFPNVDGTPFTQADLDAARSQGVLAGRAQLKSQIAAL